MSSKNYRWREGDGEIVRSICWSPPGCHGGCGVLLHVQDGRLAKLEGDTDNHFNDGRLCVRGLTVQEMLYHPQRLHYPLLRVGKRGENRWKRISYKKAIQIVADQFLSIKTSFGAASVIFCKGTARDIGGWLPRLCYGFGSPNYFGLGPANGNACYRPRVAVSTAMLGSMMVPDLGQFAYSNQEGGVHTIPKCILVWGANPVYTHPDGLFGGKLIDCLKKGSRLIVVDPQLTWLASRAQVWLRLKPATDAALALGMIHIIFRDHLIDDEFCYKWVHGTNDLKKVAAEFTPEKVSQITGVSADDLTEAAQLFARNKPANLVWGVGVDMNPGCLGTIQALISLVALTGNIENPGGMALPGDPYGVRRRGDDIADFPDVKIKPIGAEQYPLLEVGNPYAQPDLLLEQMETDNPYPIKAAWIQGAGIIPSAFADPNRAIRLLKKLDFTVMVDVFLNPAAVAFADIILPAAMYPEKDSIYVHFSQVGAINKALEPPGECRSDAQIILDLGKKIAPQYFPWNDVKGWLDHRLGPAGLDFEQLRHIGSVTPELEAQKQTKGKLRADGNLGFNTPSGKIELAASILERCGLNPLPHSQIVQPVDDIVYSNGKEYPFVLTTGARKPYFFCMEHRQAPSLRQFQPQPQVYIHPETAKNLQISQRDTVMIETPFGSCQMQAKITLRFKPDVIHCDGNWWFPEKEGAEPTLFGVQESNVNALFPSELQGPSGFGYPFRSFFCTISKVNHPENI